MVIVEALACGTPVIAFPAGAASELVIDGRTGFLVEDETTMAAAIGHLGSISARGGLCHHALACSSPSDEHGHASRSGDRLQGLTLLLAERTFSVLEGSTFVVSDRLGDMRDDEGSDHGFFCQDTRFLSRWVLLVSEKPLKLLGLAQQEHFAAQFFLTPSVGPETEAPCSVMRRRLIDHVWMEELYVINHRHESCTIDVTLELDTDFADLFGWSGRNEDGDLAAR